MDTLFHDHVPTLNAIAGSDGPICSPGRASLRSEAFKCMERQACKMRKRVAQRDGALELSVGSVVQVALADVDRTRVDPRNLTCVVVECVRKGEVEQELKYKVATPQGVLKTLYTRPYLRPLVGVTPELMGLAETLDDWESLPVLSVRTTANSTSMVGGQGMKRCNCQGDCLGGKCACHKANRLCNSRCHKNNYKCANHD